MRQLRNNPPEMRKRVTRQQSKLPPLEIDICLRLKSAREIAGFTQDELAARIGVPRDRLSTYEKCRAPLRCNLALRICRQLIISEEWLATGRHNAMIATAIERGERRKADWRSMHPIFVRQCMDVLAEDVARSIPPGVLFSEALHTRLAASYAALARTNFYTPRVVLTEVPEPELAKHLLGVLIDRWMLLLAHVAPESASEAWNVQRHFCAGMIEAGALHYETLFKLGFDIARFQEFRRALRSHVPEQAASQESPVLSEGRVIEGYERRLPGIISPLPKQKHKSKAR